MNLNNKLNLILVVMHMSERISINALRDFVNAYRKKLNEIVYRGYGGTIEEIKHEPHDGGVYVIEYDRNEWIYFLLSNGYGLALWKFEKALKNADKNLFQKYVKYVYF